MLCLGVGWKCTVSLQRWVCGFTIDGQQQAGLGIVSHRITGGFQGRWFFWVLLLLGLIAGGCDSSGSPTEPSASLTPSEVEFHLLQLTHGERSAAGLNPALIRDGALSEVARNHSEAMRDLGFFGHEGPDGGTLRQRLRAAGIDFQRAAENLSKVTNSTAPATFAHELLMDSDHHRANILNPGFRYVGIGVSRSTDTFWITQIFIKP